MKLINKILFSVVFFCIANTAFSQVFTEGFEGATFPPTNPGNWAVMNNGVGTTVDWTETSVSTNVHSGAKAAYVDREDIGAGNTSQDWLITPQITIPADGQLRFFTKQAFSGNNGSTYEIRVSTNASQTNQAAFTTVQTWTEVTLNTTYNVYQEKTVNLPYSAGTQLYIAFVKINNQPNTSMTGDRWLIDDVKVVQQCLDPSILTVGTITPTSASLAWINNGSATAWEVEVVPSANTPTGVGVTAGTNPYVYTSLTPGTAYKYYVRANCGSGNFSQWVGPFNFSTPPAGTTCSSPIIIPSLPYSHSSNTNLYGDEVDIPQGTDCLYDATNYMQGSDVFYSYTATFTGDMTVSMTPTVGNSSLFVYDGCGNVGVSCLGAAADFTANPRVIPSLSVTNGQTYIFVISSSTTPAAGIPYSLLIQQVSPSCNLPVVNVNSITSTSAVFNWNYISQQNDQIELVLNDNSNGDYIPNNFTTVTSQSFNAINLIPGSSYTLWVRHNCNGAYSPWAKSTIHTYCDSPQVFGASYPGGNGSLNPDLTFTYQPSNSPSTLRREVCIVPYESLTTPFATGLYTEPGSPFFYQTTGLEHDIIYNAYVRSDCGVNGQSDWSAPYKIGGGFDFSEDNCVKRNSESITQIKYLFKDLVNHLLGIVNSGGTVADGYNPVELQNLSQHLSEIDPKIYNFSYQNGTLEFSFSNHPGASRKDVKITGYSPSFGLLTDFDISSYVSPLYFIYNTNANFGNNTCRLFLKHIKFCDDTCTSTLDVGIYFSDCQRGSKTATKTATKIATKIESECEYTCGNRTVYMDFENFSPTLGYIEVATYQWTFKDSEGNIVGTSTDYNPSFTFTTVGNNNTINLSIVDSNGCVTTFDPEIVVVRNCTSCTTTNPRTPHVKQLFTNLINKLLSLPSGTITNGFTCPELVALTPYIVDLNPSIVNFTIDLQNKLSFSFGYHDCGKTIVCPQDVEIYFGNTPSGIASLGNMTGFEIVSYTDSNTQSNCNANFENTDSQMPMKTKHINFCPDEICVNHVAIVVDESGSLSGEEKTQIRRQLRWFLQQQAVKNNNGGNMFISLIGMSDDDNLIRPDNIIYTRITDANLTTQFLPWVENYGNRYGTVQGISEASDYWRSGLEASLATPKIPDMVIMITDGSETANLANLKATMLKFNNHDLHSSDPDNIDPTKPHLYTIGIDNGFYVYDEQTAIGKLPRNQDPNYVPSLRSSSPTSRVTPALALSLKYLLDLQGPEFPFNSLEDFKKDYYGHLDFSYIGDPANEFYISNKIKDAGISCRIPVEKDICDDCYSFQPQPGFDYVLDAWAKEELNVQVQNYPNPKIKLSFYDIGKNPIINNIDNPDDPTVYPITFSTKGDIIESWQRIGGKFKVPSNTAYIEFELINESNSVPVFFDDIRIYPVKGSMKSFVYDPETFRLMSELDENNFATFYEYDNEGGLVRIKKETARGVKTIQETRSGNVIKP